MPPVEVDLDTEEYSKAYALAEKILVDGIDDRDVEIFKGFTATLKSNVIAELLKSVDKLSKDTCRDLGDKFKLSGSALDDIESINELGPSKLTLQDAQSPESANSA